MLTKIKKMNKRDNGFTIVEIMIVMAIIGMMLLAMLLVVPNLRRNARNKQRRDDVGSLISALSEYTSSNSGALPAAASDFTGNAKLSYYDAATEVNYVNSSTAVTSAPGTDANVVYIRNFAKCNGNAIQSTAGATRRNVVAYFHIETSGNPQPQCQEI